MTSYNITLAESSASRAEASPAPLASTVTSVFGYIMNATPPLTGLIARDRCFRPTSIYNNNYDLTKPPPLDRHIRYSPYVYREPLYDDRLVIVARLLARWTIALLTKRARTAWVWRLKYTLLNSIKLTTPILIWACKLCYYDEAFLRKQDFMFNVTNQRWE